MSFGVFAFSFLVVMPLLLGTLAILTEHRRKMAELRLQASKTDLDRVIVLERRIEALTELVHEQTITLDGLARAERVDPRVNA